MQPSSSGSINRSPQESAELTIIISALQTVSHIHELSVLSRRGIFEKHDVNYNVRLCHSGIVAARQRVAVGLQSGAGHQHVASFSHGPYEDILGNAISTAHGSPCPGRGKEKGPSCRLFQVRSSNNNATAFPPMYTQGTSSQLEIISKALHHCVLNLPHAVCFRDGQVDIRLRGEAEAPFRPVRLVFSGFSVVSASVGTINGNALPESIF